MTKHIITRVARAWLVHMTNLISAVMPDDPISRKFRPKLFQAIGCKFHSSSRMSGGGYVNGTSASCGPGCFINRSVYWDLNGSVQLGSSVFVGHHVKFITTVHELGESSLRCGPITSSNIVVGDGAWIGAGAIILPGVNVGAGSVVAAGAVVTKDIEPDVLVAGSPARFIRHLTDVPPA